MAEARATAGANATTVQPPEVAEHFASMAQQAHAAHLGMWVFLASEVLLFAGLFGLYAALRAAHPMEFGAAVARNTKTLGSVNTAVLLTSGYLVASAVHALRRGSSGGAVRRVAAAVALGGVFLVIKGVEYAEHFREGIYPGGQGRFFLEHARVAAGTAPFWTLYFVTTGLHALHVAVGMGVLSWLGYAVARGRITAAAPHGLAVGALFWHLVDAIWIVVWPLYYLAAGG